MPQLDKVTFFAQVTWSLACYVFLYFLFSVHVAPAIGRVLKVRSKINLGGDAAGNQALPFSSAVSRIPNVSNLAPTSFLKISNLTSKVAVSSVVEALNDRV